MRVSTSQLQQLTIFTTVLTGAGIGTMYYLLQKKFVESDYHRLALQKLEACPVAMESLGAPPLKVHNIHVTDTNNRIDQHTAQGCHREKATSASGRGGGRNKERSCTSCCSPWRLLDIAAIKIPVTGSQTGGYLYTSSIQDPDTNRWNLKQAILKLREGQTIDLLNPPPASTELTEGLDSGRWH
ncbi:cytochrome c oxidase assembly factor 1 homolog isoform X1 [Anarhichas minor]|uniref:cytochrome c oxidase assembly factor 1 homolog isoform X1 n=1 Tax=Anarhichas minor TaxID=65739 RepID=UPI003F73E8FB